jgi:hypothetical protein
MREGKLAEYLPTGYLPHRNPETCGDGWSTYLGLGVRALDECLSILATPLPSPVLEDGLS